METRPSNGAKEVGVLLDPVEVTFLPLPEFRGAVETSDPFQGGGGGLVSVALPRSGFWRSAASSKVWGGDRST